MTSVLTACGSAGPDASAAVDVAESFHAAVGAGDGEAEGGDTPSEDDAPPPAPATE